MAADPLPLYEVLRRCACGAEWMGKSFVPQKPDEPARTATCEACGHQWELLTEALQRPLPEPKIADVELDAPKEVGDDVE